MAVPFESAQDWATFADAIVLIRIEGEVRLDTSPSELTRGEGSYPRQVTAVVEKTLWSQPAARRTVSERVTWQNGEWLFSEDHPERRLIIAEAGAWGDLGHEYVAPMVYLTTQDRWKPVSLIAADGGVIGQGASGELVPGVAKGMNGQPVEALAGLIGRTRPYAGAQGVMDQPFGDRVKAARYGQ